VPKQAMTGSIIGPLIVIVGGFFGLLAVIYRLKFQTKKGRQREIKDKVYTPFIRASHLLITNRKASLSDRALLVHFLQKTRGHFVICPTRVQKALSKLENLLENEQSFKENKKRIIKKVYRVKKKLEHIIRK